MYTLKKVKKHLMILYVCIYVVFIWSLVSRSSHANILMTKQYIKRKICVCYHRYSLCRHIYIYICL